MGAFNGVDSSVSVDSSVGVDSSVDKFLQDVKCIISVVYAMCAAGITFDHHLIAAKIDPVASKVADLSTKIDDKEFECDMEFVTSHMN